MTSLVCVDASMVIKLVVAEPGSDQADRLWESWIQAETTVLAPSLLNYEMTAILRKKTSRGELSPDVADRALAAAFSLDIETVAFSHALHHRALELARQFDRPTAYDAHYLALAEAEDCEFWTVDRRLYNSVQNRFSLIRWLEEF